MSLSQFDFWARLNEKIAIAAAEDLITLDRGIRDLASGNLLIGHRQAYASVQRWAQEVYNDMTGVPNDPPPLEEPDDDLQL